ncbi:MAG: hypothetical protein DYG89_10980 [Caldilinea sp. CFX5]|nr:hypothetical protein [Caldilinea sp. CFX5]
MTHHTTQQAHDVMDTTQEQSILNDIHEGMTVYDANQEKIGTVDYVQFGAASDSQRAQGSGPATVAPADNGYDQPLVDMVASVFNPSDMPDEMAQKLQHSGFIRIDSNSLFAADRYVIPDRIARVDSNGVYLKVTRDELLRRT